MQWTKPRAGTGRAPVPASALAMADPPWQVVGLPGATLFHGPAALTLLRQNAVGVVLSAGISAHHYDIVLLYRDGRSTPIAESLDETEVVARWRRAAALLGLPPLMQRPDGTILAVCAMANGLILGSTRLRRRSAVLKRRPRFLQRRRGGSLPQRPTVLRDAALVDGPETR